MFDVAGPRRAVERLAAQPSQPHHNGDQLSYRNGPAGPHIVDAGGAAVEDDFDETGHVGHMYEVAGLRPVAVDDRGEAPLGPLDEFRDDAGVGPRLARTIDVEEAEHGGPRREHLRHLLPRQLRLGGKCVVGPQFCYRINPATTRGSPTRTWWGLSGIYTDLVFSLRLMKWRVRPRPIDVRACRWIAISATCFRLRFRSIIYH